MYWGMFKNDYAFASNGIAFKTGIIMWPLHPWGRASLAQEFKLFIINGRVPIVQYTRAVRMWDGMAYHIVIQGSPEVVWSHIYLIGTQSSGSHRNVFCLKQNVKQVSLVLSFSIIHLLNTLSVSLATFVSPAQNLIVILKWLFSRCSWTRLNWLFMSRELWNVDSS